MLYDEDILYLQGKTIPQLFLQFFDQVCLFCQLDLVTDNFYTMPCECKICAKCLEMRINAVTDGKVILNDFEKSKKYFKLFSDNVKSKTVNCACGNPFDVQYAISASKPDIESYIKKSKDRLVEQTQSYCAMCRTNVINKESKAEKNKTVIVTTNKFPIVSEEDPNTVIIHVLCKQCLLTLKGDIMRMTREGKLANASKTVPLLCLICNKKVHQAELKYIKPIMKDGDGGCCTIL